MPEAAHPEPLLACLPDAGDPDEAAQWVERFLGPDAPQLDRLRRTRAELSA